MSTGTARSRREEPHPRRARAWVLALVAALVGALLPGAAAQAAAVTTSVATGTITGVVRDADGAPLADVDIDIAADDGSFYEWAVTDENGRFTVIEVPVAVATWFTVYPSWDREDLAVLRTPGPAFRAGESVEVDITLPVGAQVSGTVVDASGASVEASVSLDQDGASVAYEWTDEAGLFSLRQLAPGTYSLRVTPSDSRLRSTVLEVDVEEGGDVVLDPVVLVEGGSVSGVVTGPQGPAAAVHVYLEQLYDGGSTGTPTGTDATGRFTFTGLEPGTYRVRAGGAGSDFVEQWFEGAPTADDAELLTVRDGAPVTGVDFALEPGAALNGTVRGPDGPVAGVSVSVQTVDGSGYGWASTAEDGTYRVDGLAAGTYVVQFLAPEGSGLERAWFDGAGRAADATPVTVAVGENRSGIDVELARGATVSGTVTTTGGLPVQDARVYMYDPTTGDWGGSASTGSDGVFRMTGVPAGSFTLSASGPMGTDLLRADVEDVAVPAGGTVRDLHVVLAEGGAVVGTVTGPQGPVEGVQVTTSSDGTGGHGGSQSTTTGPDGSYELRAVPPGEATVLVGGVGTGFLVQERSVTVSAGSREVVPFTLEPGAVVSGTVTGPDGPLSDAAVTLFAGAAGDSAGTVWTDEQGAFRADGLAAGTYRLRASAADMVSEYFDDAATLDAATGVTVAAGAEVSGVDMRLDRGGAITGTVVVPAGFSGQVWVSAAASDGEGYGSAAVAIDGTYRMEGLPAGEYTVQFSSYGGNVITQYYDGVHLRSAATPVAVELGETATGIDARLVAGATVSGTVSGPDGPVEGAFVSVDGVAADLDGDAPGSYAVTDASGRYVATGLPAGEYVVRAGASAEYFPAYHGGADRDGAGVVTVAAEQRVDGIDIVLERGATVSGVVTGTDGEPVTHAQVYAIPVDDGVDWPSGPVDDTGRFRVGALPAGDYRIFVQPGDGSGHAAGWLGGDTFGEATVVTVGRAQDVVGLEVRLGVGAVVRGRVTTVDGTPVAGAQVEIVSDHVWSTAGAVTAADGTYELRNVPREVRILVHSDGYASRFVGGAYTWHRATVLDVPAGSVRTGADVRLERAGVISGSVRDEEGRFPQGYVGAWTTDGEWYSGAEITTDGTYELSGLAPGRYLVSFHIGYEDAATQWYDQVIRAEDATEVVVTAGGAVSGIDAVVDSATGPGPTPDPDPVRFSDVAPGGTFTADIEWLVQRGITTGYTDGTFRPTAAVSRQAMAAFLYRFAGEPAWSAPARSPFSDIPAGGGFYREISWLAGTGISTGTRNADGSFAYKPTDAVSRQAMAAFLYRFAGSPDWSPPAVSPFADVSPASPFYREITWLAAQKVTTGTRMPDGTVLFKPTDAVSRQAMAAFLHRMEPLVAV